MVLAKPCWFAHNRTGRYLDNRKKLQFVTMLTAILRCSTDRKQKMI